MEKKKQALAWTVIRPRHRSETGERVGREQAWELDCKHWAVTAYVLKGFHAGKSVQPRVPSFSVPDGTGVLG